MYKTPLVTCDDKRIRQGASYSAATLSKTASYTITAANIISAGGRLIVNVTAAAADAATKAALAVISGYDGSNQAPVSATYAS